MIDNQTFRSREEIETELQKLMVHGLRGPNAAWPVVHRLFDEVRAYGAAEERAKGADEQDPVGYLHVLNNGFDPADSVVLSATKDCPWGILDECNSAKHTFSPVYDRPASAVALEARVKELEDAINTVCERISAPAWTICANTHCERAEECRSPSECGGTGKPGALRILLAVLKREGGV